jgi:hypothetical protein
MKDDIRKKFENVLDTDEAKRRPAPAYSKMGGRGVAKKGDCKCPDFSSVNCKKY